MERERESGREGGGRGGNLLSKSESLSAYTISRQNLRLSNARYAAIVPSVPFLLLEDTQSTNLVSRSLYPCTVCVCLYVNICDVFQALRGMGLSQVDTLLSDRVLHVEPPVLQTTLYHQLL